MKILVVTNDGTVFFEEEGKVKRIFGGRIVEVLWLEALLSQEHEVSHAVISGKYGLVDGETRISWYNDAPDTAAGYAELQERTDYAGRLKEMSRHFDVTMVFVPKEMLRILIGNGSLPRNTVAVAAPEFKDTFERNGWMFLERKGARVGKKNTEIIISSFSSSL